MVLHFPSITDKVAFVLPHPRRRWSQHPKPSGQCPAHVWHCFLPLCSVIPAVPVPVIVPCLFDCNAARRGPWKSSSQAPTEPHFLLQRHLSPAVGINRHRFIGCSNHSVMNFIDLFQWYARKNVAVAHLNHLVQFLPPPPTAHFQTYCGCMVFQHTCFPPFMAITEPGVCQWSGVALISTSTLESSITFRISFSGFGL